VDTLFTHRTWTQTLEPPPRHMNDDIHALYASKFNVACRQPLGKYTASPACSVHSRMEPFTSGSSNG
jgi:hypothetical protein